MWKILLALALSNSLLAADLPEPLIPDPSQTEGTICTKDDDDFKEYRYDEKIPYCQRRVSSSLKRRIYEDYGIPAKCQDQYTIDHFYPLALGGNNDKRNLWPEHKALKHVRQNLEVVLFHKMQNGDILQDDALREIRDAKLNPPVDEIEKGDYCDQFIVRRPFLTY